MRTATIGFFAAIAIALPVGDRNEARGLDRELASLVVVLDKHELTGALAGLSWRAASPTLRSGTNGGRLLEVRLRAAGLLQRTTHPSDKPSSWQHACGVAGLLLGDVRYAVDSFQCAVARAPATPAYWSDLSVALQELAVAERNPQYLADALAASDRALHLEDTFQPALFNRAMALDSLGLETSAIQAYRICVKQNNSSPWAVDAAQRASHLREDRTLRWRQAVASFPNATDSQMTEVADAFSAEMRAYAEDVLLAGWGERELAAQPVEAAAKLGLARRLARALHASRAESVLMDEVSTIDHASLIERASLAWGHRLFGEARAAYQKRDLKTARKAFAQASEYFRSTRSPMWIEARFQYNNCLDNPPIIYVPVRVNSQHPGEDQMLRASLDALASYQHVAGTPLPTIGSDMFAGAYSLLGHRSEVWRMRPSIFRGMGQGGDLAGLQRALNNTAKAEALDGRWESAHALLNVAVDPVLQMDPATTSDSLLWRAVSDERIGWHDRFSSDLAQARSAVDAIRSPSIAVRAHRAIFLGDAIGLTSSCPHCATVLLTQLIATLPPGSQLLSHEARLERARAQRAEGNYAGAIADLEAALHDVEVSRAMAEGYHNAYSRPAEEIVSQLVDIHEQNGDVMKALDVVQRGYERVSESVSERERSTLKSGMTLLRYVVLPGRVLTFVSTANAIRVARTDVTVDEIDETVADFASCVRSGNPCEPLSSRLAGWLLDPITELSATRIVIIAADRHLARVPFAALTRKATHRPLIEDVGIVFVGNPSAKALNSAPATTNGFVAVGNPALDEAQFPSLPPLYAAEREAEEAIRYHGGGILLTRRDATRERVMAALQTATVVHLGVHALVSANDPARSCLVLAPSPASSGLLYLREIEHLNLWHLRLVVLFGCRTADQVDGGGDTNNLALAFISGGAENAIANLWDLDDGVGHTVSTWLHRELLSGKAPSEALRDVQMRMLHSPDKHLSAFSAWSGLRLYSRIDRT